MRGQITIDIWTWMGDDSIPNKTPNDRLAKHLLSNIIRTFCHLWPYFNTKSYLNIYDTVSVQFVQMCNGFHTVLLPMCLKCHGINLKLLGSAFKDKLGTADKPLCHFFYIGKTKWLQLPWGQIGARPAASTKLWQSQIIVKVCALKWNFFIHQHLMCAFPLQWCHMDAMAYHITGHSNVYSTDCWQQLGSNFTISQDRHALLHFTGFLQGHNFNPWHLRINGIGRDAAVKSSLEMF